MKRFESSVKEGMDSAQKELARAIESGDAKAQVEANKRIATLAFDNARLQLSGVSNTYGVHLFAMNYNVLRIMSGMGGLAYSN